MIRPKTKDDVEIREGSCACVLLCVAGLAWHWATVVGFVGQELLGSERDQWGIGALGNSGVSDTAGMLSRRSVSRVDVEGMIGPVMAAANCIEPHFRVLFPMWWFPRGKLHLAAVSLFILEKQRGILSQDMRRYSPGLELQR